MFSLRGTVRYEERSQGYRDVEKFGKHCSSECCVLSCRGLCVGLTIHSGESYSMRSWSLDNEKALVH